MIPVPTLQPVPNLATNNLDYKLTIGGAMRLKDGRFLSRYTGNTKYRVDLNGQLLTTAEFKKMQAGGDGKKPKKKKAPVETGAVKTILEMIPGTISENLSTVENDLSTVPPELSTEKAPKVYTIHKRKVRERIANFVNTRYGKYELYLWTISFPERTPDKICFQALQTWLTTQRQKKRLFEYLWVTERQKNGTVHFHLAVPHYMDVKTANRAMKRVLITFCRRGLMPCTSRFIGEKYNGVDIQKRKDRHGNKRITNFAEKRGSKALANYISKYVSKNDGEFEHLAWHNSRAFSCMFTGVCLLEQEFEGVNGFLAYLNQFKVLVNDWCVWSPWGGKPPDKVLTALYELNSYIQYKNNLFHPFDRGGKVKYYSPSKN